MKYSRLKKADDSIDDWKQILINSGVENVENFINDMIRRYNKGEIKKFLKDVQNQFFFTDIKELYPNLVVEKKIIQNLYTLAVLAHFIR